MSLLPRSMAGQLAALLLSGLVVAHVIAVMAHYGDGNLLIHPLSSLQIKERIYSAYKLVLEYPEREAPGLLDTMSSPTAQFGIDRMPPPSGLPMSEQESRLAMNLRARLGLLPDARVYVRMAAGAVVDVEPGAPRWFVEGVRNASIQPVDIDILLPDGRWLSSRQWPTMRRDNWRGMLAFSLPVSTLPVLLLVFLFMRRILRPHKALAWAAERVSRGERVAPLVVEGPSEVREITEAFNTMQGRLTRFVEDRTRMLAAISHDFRTPLTALRIRAEMIEDGRQREPMVRMLTEMGQMLDETLQFARDDSVQEETREVDIRCLVDDVVGMQRELGRKVEHVGGAAVHYRCRPLGLKRALTNLVENAARYGQVWVRVVPGGGGSAMRIEVDDDGPGLDPAQLERAFDPFVRFDKARNSATGGTGLGLAIARSCVKAHGGEIRLHNRQEGGLRAVITLPAAAS